MWWLVIATDVKSLGHATDVKSLHAAAKRHALRGDVEAAAVLFKRVSFTNLTLEVVADARLQLAMRALHRRPVTNASFHEALGFVTSALEAQPLPSAHLLAADLYRDIWYLDEAKSQLREVIKQDPLNGFALTLLGQTHMEQGNFKSAKAAFRRAKTEHAAYALAALEGDSTKFDRAPLSYVRDIFEVDERRRVLFGLGTCRAMPEYYVHVYGLEFHRNERTAPPGGMRPNRGVEIGGCSPLILQAPGLGRCMDLVADDLDFLDAASWDGLDDLDAVIARDAAPYVGRDLSILFSLVNQALAMGGFFLLTTELDRKEHTKPSLSFTGRWQHPHRFTTRLARRFGFDIIEATLFSEPTSLAWDNKKERVVFSDAAMAATNYNIFKKIFDIPTDLAQGEGDDDYIIEIDGPYVSFFLEEEQECEP